MVRKANESDVLKWTSAQQERFWSKIKKGGEDECWHWLKSRDRKGYGRTGLKGQSFAAYRIVWILTHGKPIPSGLCVLHKCDNSPCCNPSHLKLGTQTENMADMVQKGRGRGPQGEKHGRALLTRKEVLQIREEHQQGVSQRKLAAKFGVGQTAIRNIVTGCTWGHIGGPTIKRRSREELKGEGNPSAKLSERTVVEIREKHYSGAPVSALVNEFGVTETTIHNIVTGRTWKSAEGPKVESRPQEEMRGETHPNAKLTEDAVVKIRERHYSGTPTSVLANEFGVTKTAIRNIVTGRTWRHAGGPVKGQFEVSKK